MRSKGIHLHVHCHESRLDGYSTAEELVERASELNMPAIALTDHGVCGGIPEFAKACKKYNIKGIYGSEIYLTDDMSFGAEENQSWKEEFLESLMKTEYSLKKHYNKEYKELNSIFTEYMSSLRKNNLNFRESYSLAEEMAIKKLMNREEDSRGIEEVVSDIEAKALEYYKKRSFHLVLLAKNEKGLENLFSIVSDGYTKGFYRYPRVDLNYIRENKLGEGLIATSACMGSMSSQFLLGGLVEEAKEHLIECRETFEHFYLEKQATLIPQQLIINKEIDKLSTELDIKKILTSDVHYARKEDIDAHDIMVTMGQASCITNEDRMIYASEFWIKSDEEMMEKCHDEEAWANTLEIADMINFIYDPQPRLPTYLKNGDKDTKELLKEHAIKGLIERSIQDKIDFPYYFEELKRELGVINSEGFADYFLIVEDLMDAARNKGFLPGPGRGSAVGSLVCYCIGITQIDPIKRGLIFERFLNPERIGLPDIDIDFSDDGASFVYQYLQEEYGIENVSKIGTRTRLGGRASCSAIGKTLGMDPLEYKKVTSMIPEGASKLAKMIDTEEGASMKEIREKHPKLWDYLLRLEGRIKSVGVHPAGVIISNKAIKKEVPLRMTDKGVVVSQFDKDEIEDCLVKFDILVILNLEIIQMTLGMIEEKLDVNTLNTDNPDVYRGIYQKKLLSGIFQMESEGMSGVVDSIVPETFSDLSAIAALYRPGPMQFIETYAKRKHGREKVVYPDERLKEILEDTYGVWVLTIDMPTIKRAKSVKA